MTRAVLSIIVLSACGSSALERENDALRAQLVVLQSQNETLRRQVRAAQRPAEPSPPSFELPGIEHEDPASITVFVAADGSTYVGSTPVDEAELARVARDTGEGVRAFIAADRAVPYQRVVQIMDVLRDNGIEDLVLSAGSN